MRIHSFSVIVITRELFDSSLLNCFTAHDKACFRQSVRGCKGAFLMRSTARFGCVLNIPMGHKIKNEAVFSAVDSIPYFELWSSSRRILIQNIFLLA